jgi:Prokaryotic N-terminal methylation motif
VRRRPADHRGFTIVELLIGTTLGAAVMAGVLSTFVFLARNLTRLANYRVLEAKGREALVYIGQDLALAQAVQGGTTPTSSALSLVLPAGVVTYTYNSTAGTLLRQANFGANQSLVLLENGSCSCTAFSFNYYTTTGGAPTSQISSGVYVPYSIKMIQFSFTVQTAGGTGGSGTGETFNAVSSDYLVRNRQLPDGT